MLPPKLRFTDGSVFTVVDGSGVGDSYKETLRL